MCYSLPSDIYLEVFRKFFQHKVQKSDNIHVGCYTKYGMAKRLDQLSMQENNKRFSLRKRRLEVVGERENGRARGRHARGEGAPSPLACLHLARPFFLVPTTSKHFHYFSL